MAQAVTQLLIRHVTWVLCETLGEAREGKEGSRASEVGLAPRTLPLAPGSLDLLWTLRRGPGWEKQLPVLSVRPSTKVWAMALPLESNPGALVCGDGSRLLLPPVEGDLCL